MDKWIPNTTRALQVFHLLRQGSAILVAILLAKSGLSKADIGIYELLLYLGVLLTTFWVNGSLQGLLSIYKKLDNDNQARLLSQSWLFFMVLSAVVGGVCIWQPAYLLEILLQRESLPYLGVFGLFLFSDTTASLQVYYYLLKGQVSAMVIYGILSSVGHLLAVVVPLLLGYDLGVSVACLTVVGFGKGLWSWIYVQRHGQWGWSTEVFQSWLQVSWPLILYALVGIFNQSAGPWLVNYFYAGDAAAFATYRYGARELPLLTSLAGALSSSLIPAIAAKFTSGLQSLRNETRKLGNWLFPISIVLLLTSRWWFIAVFDPKFTNSIPLFATFLLTTPLHFIFARTLLIGLGDTHFIPFFAVGGVCLHLLLGLWFGSQWGMLGIASASVLSYGTEKLILVYYLWKRHRIKWSSYTDLQWLFIWTMMLVVVYLGWMSGMVSW